MNETTRSDGSAAALCKQLTFSTSGIDDNAGGSEYASCLAETLDDLRRSCIVYQLHTCLCKRPLSLSQHFRADSDGAVDAY